jgi:hypothetical protein
MGMDKDAVMDSVTNINMDMDTDVDMDTDMYMDLNTRHRK